MKRSMLIWRTLSHYRLTQAGVCLGAMIASAVLIGSLLVGDSVAGSLHRIAIDRLGPARHVMQTPDRLFRDALADDLQDRLDAPVSALLMLGGTASDPRASRVSNKVQLIGADERLWSAANVDITLGDGQVVLNDTLAEQLGASVGQTVVIRCEKPAALPRDAVLSQWQDTRIALRAEVIGIVGDDRLGRFSLSPTHVRSATAFVSLSWLQEQIDEPGRANTVLIMGERADDVTGDDLTRAVNDAWRLSDARLNIKPLPETIGGYELSSGRVFIDAAITDALIERHDGIPILTYLANELRIGDRAVPYLMVTGAPADWFDRPIQSGEIWLNDWVASEEDLRAKPGDTLTMRYHVTGQDRRLVEAADTFTVSRIVEMTGRYADRALMPRFPGIADVELQADWDPGFAIDTSRIRDRDELYWERHRGTPKAFVSIETAQQMWANRFGNATAIRFDAGVFGSVEQADNTIRSSLDPRSFGLVFRPVRAEAIDAAASGPARYFGYLFAGLSQFIIVAAVLLMAMVFVIGLEQRRGQIGLFRAVGMPSGVVRGLLMRETLIVSLIGCVLGVPLGAAYTAAIMVGLQTVWADAINGAPVVLHIQPASMAIGGGVALAAAMGATWLVTRGYLKKQTARLLTHTPELGARANRPSKGRIGLIALLVLAALASMGWSLSGTAEAQTLGFMLGGTLLLVAALLCARLLMHRRHRPSTDALTTRRLARLGVTRRSGRSLAAISLLAIGVFMMVAVSANRLRTPSDLSDPSGGAGGYALMAESTTPIYHGLIETEDRVIDETMRHAAVLPMRVHGDTEASCLNLNRAPQPMLLGVEPETLRDRGAFSFAGSSNGATNADAWLQLGKHDSDEPDVVPAITDQPTAMWSLGMTIGDELEYTDERGRPFRVRLVGVVKSSILQGRFLIDRDRFVERFPSSSGYRAFLIDTDRGEDIAPHLRRTYEDQGMSVVDTRTRLRQLNAVQNTYLSIFLMLGGLGLVLGTLGLGVVVWRNVLDRRAEHAAMRAVGFQKRRIARLVMAEHLVLGGLGLACGAGPALVASVPTLLDRSAGVSVMPVLIALLIIASSGALWITLATKLSMRGPLNAALRDE